MAYGYGQFRMAKIMPLLNMPLEWNAKFAIIWLQQCNLDDYSKYMHK